jgi:hypothetical protein
MDHHRKIFKSEVAFEKGRLAAGGGYTRDDNPYNSAIYKNWWLLGFNASARRIDRKKCWRWPVEQKIE